MSNYSTLTVTTPAGTQTFKVGKKSNIIIDSPGPGNIRGGGSFSGFAQRYGDGVNDGAAVAFPSSRVKQLAYAQGGGNPSSPDLITVTLAGGDGTGGAWTTAKTVPVNVTGQNGFASAIDAHSELTIVDAIPAENNAGRYSAVVSLFGLSAISVTDAA
jgi:hypothetical protein